MFKITDNHEEDKKMRSVSLDQKLAEITVPAGVLESWARNHRDEIYADELYLHLIADENDIHLKKAKKLIGNFIGGKYRGTRYVTQDMNSLGPAKHTFARFTFKEKVDVDQLYHLMLSVGCSFEILSAGFKDYLGRFAFKRRNVTVDFLDTGHYSLRHHTAAYVMNPELKPKS